MLAARSSRISPLVRLTNAARFASMRPAAPIEVADPNILHTPRLTVRPLAWTDRAEFIRVIRLSRGHLAEHCPLHKDGETDDSLFDRLLAQSQRGLELGRAWRAGTFTADGRLVGLVNLNDISRGLESQAEANWWTAADAINRGHATEALAAVLAHAFGDLPRGLGLQRVTALIAPSNAPSRRVAAKVGMRRAGRPIGFGGWGSRFHEGGQRGLNINGREIVHDLYEVFAPLTAPRRLASRRGVLRAGLASILDTEAAARHHAD
jgi:[ribosomal protein S5]-alanine N-acetyltransferase